MNASLLTIGDELLIGQVVNTNGTWIGERLSALGIEVVRAVTVGDEEERIERELRQALGESDLVVLTGGLGPTHDDVTKRAVADELGVELEFHEELLAEVEGKFAARGRTMAAANRLLAEVPAGFEPLPNPKGTAPGLWFDGEVEGRRRAVVILPGVPYEMEALMEGAVLPRLLDRLDGAGAVQKTLLTVGKGESDLAEQLGALDGWLGRASDGTTLRLAFLPSPGAVRLRLTATGPERAAAGARLAEAERHVRDRLGDLLFGEGDDTLEAVVGRMLRERDLSLATAESCTGGLLGHLITNVPGASAYYHGGAVVYGNDQKVLLLRVDPEAIEREGAVSEPVARQLAEGVRMRLHADIGIATTGIAGPGGGTPEKPVGTIWLGYADDQGSYAVRLQLATDRDLNKRLGAMAALNLVRRQLLRRDRAVAEAEA
ncbi:MAG: competence/damage-inducible protein A [Rhodothermales bacterium]|nr:competence/damage-inducible protein A [Rhodothermales bacterium]